MKDNTKKYADKPLPPGWKPMDGVVEALRNAAEDNKISCQKATRIAKDLDVPPIEVGRTIDFLGFSIVKCQLGLFGYQPEKKVVRPAKTVSRELYSLIESSLVNGRLPCKSAWDIAKRLKIGKMDVSAACEAKGIKIVSCQLGAF